MRYRATNRAEWDALKRVLCGEGIRYTGLGEIFFREDTKMITTEAKPLQPLHGGKVVLVGVKASNFGEEIKNHPQVVMWESQDQRWIGQELPSNTKAVFVTRWVGHQAFRTILKEARKRQITMFNPEGTGMIAKQVKELLGMEPKELSGEAVEKIAEQFQKHDDYTPVLTKEPVTMKSDTEVQKMKKGQSKIDPLMPFVDPNLNYYDNAERLIIKAKEMGIKTTVASIANRISVVNRKASGAIPKSRPGARKVQPTDGRPTRTHKHVDVIVEILDNMVKELQDMRDYLVATTEENRTLKERFDAFKKALG